MLCMFIHQIPSFVPALLPRFTWSKPADRQIYLTFDDGPTPEITDFVLECLAYYEAKATFFCIGKNVLANPTLTKRIQTAGHSIGNHTMNHSNAWKMDYASFLADVEKCEDVFAQQHITSVGFRPPYGRITRKMYLECYSMECINGRLQCIINFFRYPKIGSSFIKTWCCCGDAR
jgi:peptidoglycan/xylan/chitin deacetylase (PgdA/CDA1 family)